MRFQFGYWIIPWQHDHLSIEEQAPSNQGWHPIRSLNLNEPGNKRLNREMAHSGFWKINAQGI